MPANSTAFSLGLANYPLPHFSLPSRALLTLHLLTLLCTLPPACLLSLSLPVPLPCHLTLFAVQDSKSTQNRPLQSGLSQSQSRALSLSCCIALSVTLSPSLSLSLTLQSVLSLSLQNVFKLNKNLYALCTDNLISHPICGLYASRSSTTTTTTSRGRDRAGQRLSKRGVAKGA